MKPLLSEKLYCSLDIETSGFDPLANEILEVGFVFFEIRGKSLEVREEWTQVFKPSKPVSAQILGLTGISQKELDEAPLFSEHRDFIQKKLKDAVIVGHNVIFDIKFLEGFGVKFSGKVIDTLDLAQFILPTHHSYNLENLMHTFGISHKEAHRALADSKATVKLLEKLLQVYCGFSSKLKVLVNKLVQNKNFLWEDFLNVNFEPLIFSEIKKSTKEHIRVNTQEMFQLETETVYNFAINADFNCNIASAESKKKILLVVPKARTALGLFKNGVVKKVVFLPEMQFDEKKFEQLLKKKDLSPEEIKFLLKILVWQDTNWQNEILLDLNLSFFGGQFKSLISGGKILEDASAKVIACDQATFLYLSENKLFTDRHAVICGLSEFETSVTSNIGAKTSWGYITYLLKSFYNPELGSGKTEYKNSVEEGLLAGDLFFGLVNALFQTDPPGFQYIKITNEFEFDDKYLKVKNAASSFIEKISSANKKIGSKEISRFTENLQNFFSSEENRVKWIELSENRCSFISMPLSIKDLVKDILKPFALVSFADALESKILPKFFLKRLGLEGFKIKQVEESKKPKTKSLKQGDLFSAVKKVFSKQAIKVNYHCVEKTAGVKEIMEIVGSNKILPAAVLFQGTTQVRDFYDQNYQELKQRTSVLAQIGSGGSNKIFRNFGINPKTLLLATDKFILKHLTNQAAVEPVSSLEVKTLVICRLPFDQFTHPYQEALSKSLPNAFEDYSLPRALFNFQSLIKFFYSSQLTDIYVIDSKLSKPYAKLFKDYWVNIPNSELKA